MMLKGTPYGVLAGSSESSLNCGSWIKHGNDNELDPRMCRGPWEIVRLSAKDTGSALEMVELGAEKFTGPWEFMCSPAKDGDLESEMVELEKMLRGFTVYDIPYLQRQKYQGFELVVAQSCVLELQEAVGGRYHVQRQVDPTTPDSGEVRIFGLQKAKERACRRFLHNAVDAISNGWREGAGQCYRRAAELCGLDARLRMTLQCKGFAEKVWYKYEKGTFDDDDCLTMKARNWEWTDCEAAADDVHEKFVLNL